MIADDNMSTVTIARQRQSIAHVTTYRLRQLIARARIDCRRQILTTKMNSPYGNRLTVRHKIPRPTLFYIFIIRTSARRFGCIFFICIPCSAFPHVKNGQNIFNLREILGIRRFSALPSLSYSYYSYQRIL